MLTLVRDLYAYQAWADAQVFQLIDQTPAAQKDAKVLQLLNHMYAVYKFFVLSVQGEAPTREELMQEIPLAELRLSFEKIHRLSDGYLPKLRESRLRDRVLVPWFKDFQPSCQEALVQAAMHSQNHRGQVLTLLRTLGAKTKPVDYIVWASEGRPTPQWNLSSAIAS